MNTSRSLADSLILYTRSSETSANELHVFIAKYKSVYMLQVLIVAWSKVDQLLKTTAQTGLKLQV